MTPTSDHEYLSLWKFNPAPRQTMRQIAEEVAEANGLSLADLLSPSRTRNHAHPRQEAWAEIYATGRYSYPQIGRLFDRDHSTIIYGVRKANERVEKQARKQARAV